MRRRREIAQIERQEHLNQPPYERYWYWLDGPFTGTSGISYASERPVTTELAHYFPVTPSLTIAALVLILVIGVPLGITPGHERRTAPSTRVCSAIGVRGHFGPGFLGGDDAGVPVGREVQGVSRRSASCRSPSRPLNGPRHIFLPALTLAFGGFGIIARFLRTGIVGVRNEDFVRALDARGLSQRRISYKHVLKNASLSTITILGLNIGFLLSGAVIVEQIFSLPGMGTYALHVDSEQGLAGRARRDPHDWPSSSCSSTCSPTSPTAISTRRCGCHDHTTGPGHSGHVGAGRGFRRISTTHRPMGCAGSSSRFRHKKLAMAATVVVAIGIILAIIGP